MNKIMKTLCIGFIISLSMFVSGIGEVRATMVEDDWTWITDCHYDTVYNDYKGKFTLSKRDNTQSRDGGTIAIQKYDGNEYKSGKEKIVKVDAGTMDSIITYNECPKFMGINKAGKKAALFWDGASVNKWINDNGSGSVLILADDYVDMLQGVYRFHNYQAKAFECRTDGTDPACLRPSGEPRYECSYNNGELNLYITGQYFIMNTGKASTFVAPEYTRGQCPAGVYEVNKNGKTGYRFSGGTWPDICKTDASTKCKYYTQNSVLEYNVDPVVESFTKTITYYFGELKGTSIDFLYTEYNFNDKLTLTFKGKTDGSIESIDVDLNGKKVYIVTEDENKLNSKLQEFFKAKGGITLTYSFECISYDKAKEKGNLLVSGIPSLAAPETYTGDVCYAWDLGGDTNVWNPKRYYLNEAISENKELLNLADELNNLNSDLDNGWKSECENNENSTECLEFQKEAYDLVENWNKTCKHYLSDFTSMAEIVNACKDFLKNVEDYADKGYFGDRIIKVSTGTGCTETLGSLGVWLSRIYKILLIIIPILIVILGIKDFIQAQTAGKEDELKKMGATFIKRLIFGAFFVALPLLIKVIITIALGRSLADMCIF